MKLRRRVCSAGVVLASVLLGGCGATIYTPRPSPRIQIVPDGSSMSLVKNGQRYSAGAFGGTLAEAVEGNPQAQEEAREYRNRGIAGFVLSTLGGVAAGIGAGVLVGNELQPNPSTTLTDATIGMAIGGVVLSLVGSFVAASAQPHLWNAINLYNDSLPAAYPVWTPRPAYPGYPAAPGYPAGPGYGPGPVPLPSSPGPVPLPSAPPPPPASPPPSASPPPPPSAPPPPPAR